MDKGKLSAHIKLCRRNLKDKRTKCCARCPFEQEIVRYTPSLKVLFENKRARILLEDTKEQIKQARKRILGEK